MNPEKQRIKIAEACGWKHNTGESPSYGGSCRQAGWTSPEGYFVMTTWHEKTSSGLPDYLNDLNAMYEAEKILPCGYWNRYCQYLAEFGRGSVRFVSVHSTAPHRAEAFLKTLGLWEGAK